jgi:hypothetical protein
VRLRSASRVATFTLGQGSGCATITLAVHPRYGEKVNVLSSFGNDRLQIEFADGCVRLLPVAWTSLAPPSVAEFAGKPVRLALTGLKELAAWVAARGSDSNSSGRKLAHFDKSKDNLARDGAASKRSSGKSAPASRRRGIAGQCSKHQAATSLVEQVGPPRPRGGSRRRGAGRK